LPVSKLDSYFEAWQGALTRIAAAENIVIKLSALSSGGVPNFFTASIRRWVLACFEHFGTERALFASNWPMDNLSTTYPRLLVSFRKLT
jgi:predicted TIM-barrel fold metal-dependent hydrolase